jgi:hypothetical protein
LYVEGFRLVLMELLPADQSLNRGSFVFEAEVLHSNDQGWVGLYFERGERENRGAEHCFTDLVFCDQGPEAGHVRLQRQLYISQKKTNPAEVFEVKTTPKAAQWRKLVVEVRPRTVHVSWGESEREISIEELTDKTNDPLAVDIRIPNPPPPPPFDARGGLGLYVEKGSAYYRNVTVQALRSP